MKCKACNGTGKQKLRVDAEEVDEMSGPCPYTIFVNVRCEKCGGVGRIEKEEDK